MVFHDPAQVDEPFAFGHERLECKHLVGFYEGSADADLDHETDSARIDGIGLAIAQRAGSHEAMASEGIDKQDTVVSFDELGAEEQVVDAGRFNADCRFSRGVSERRDADDEGIDTFFGILELSDE